jgi:hypothetical protein
VRAFTASVDYSVPGIINVLQQDKSMACWAFATVMLESWRRGQSLELMAFLDDMGTRAGEPALFRDAYLNNTGLAPAQVERLLAALSLQQAPAASFLVTRWEEMLRDHGPLMIIGDEVLTPSFAVHARLMVGISGDGTPTGTQVDIADPGTGTRYRESLRTFLAKYEELAPTNWAGVQVLHFPSGTRAGALSLPASRNGTSSPNGQHRNLQRRRPSKLAAGFSALAAPAPPVLDAWMPLVSFVPPSSVSARFTKFTPDAWLHAIGDAWGPINLDWYPVRATLPPGVTADAVIDRWRRDINATVDQRMAFFEPYDADEAAIWTSASPTGAVIHIDMRSGASWANPDDGSVIVGRAGPDHWIFSTIWTPQDLSHPVSGNRWFGYTANDDGSFTFGTRGADRANGLLDHAMSDIIFTAAHGLWLTLQQGLANLINGMGGTATIEQASSLRYVWDDVKLKYGLP